MKSYVLNRVGGGQTSEIFAEDDIDAELQALALIGGDAVAAEQWDADGRNDDDQQMERLLLWSCEGDSINDDGARAVAQLTVVRA